MPLPAPPDRSAPPRARTMRSVAAVLVVVLIALAAGYELGRLQSVPGASLPDLGKAPAFSGFRNQLGQPVDSRQFAGKVQVVTFLSPYCTSECPLIALHLVSLEHALRMARLAPRVQIVAFNVDPRHTGPSQAAAFQREYGWNPRDLRWQFLSGTPAQTARVVRTGYHVDYQQTPLASDGAVTPNPADETPPQPEVANALAAQAKPDYDVEHDNALVLVGPHGNIRWMSSDADSESAARILRRIRAVLRDDPRAAQP